MTRRAALLAAVLLTGGLLTGGAGPSPYPPYAFVEPLPLPRATSPWSGYTPNSTVQGEQQRRFHPAPAFNLSVPLQ